MAGQRGVARPAGGIAGVLARLRAIDRALTRRDGAAVFNRMYLAVTEDVAAALARPGVLDAFDAAATQTALPPQPARARPRPRGRPRLLAWRCGAAPGSPSATAGRERARSG